MSSQEQELNYAIDVGYSVSEVDVKSLGQQSLLPRSRRNDYVLAAHLAGSLRYRVVKRLMDIAIVLAFLPVLLPVFLLIAVAIRLTSSGPIFFSHRRIRGDGEFFDLWKFRTMYSDSEKILESYLKENVSAKMEWDTTHKLVDDPRVTQVGKWLRRSSLDELPQVFNALMGSMSLVGPRPIVMEEISKYGDHFSYYCMVKPGVTGLWQVSGRSKLSYAQRVDLDCHYVMEWTLRNDFLILARTFFTVARGDGAC